MLEKCLPKCIENIIWFDNTWLLIYLEGKNHGHTENFLIVFAASLARLNLF